MLGRIHGRCCYRVFKRTEVALFVVAGNEKRGPRDNFIIEQLKRVKFPYFYGQQKLIHLKRRALEAIVSYQDAYPFAGVILFLQKIKRT